MTFLRRLEDVLKTSVSLGREHFNFQQHFGKLSKLVCLTQIVDIDLRNALDKLLVHSLVLKEKHNEVSVFFFTSKLLV